MRKLMLFSMMFVAINAIASEYIIVRNGEQTTIYDLTIGTNSTNYISTFPLTNPTVDMLKQIGLPGYLWDQLNESDGIYDIRLVECKAQLTAANAQLSNDTEYIQELEDARGLYRLVAIALTVIILIMSLVIITNSKK